MNRPKPSIEYEAITKTFKRKDGEYFCCYCGAIRGQRRTNLDHVPGVGIFRNGPPEKTPTVRVCVECNQKQSSSEAYFYCILSTVLSGSPKPADQVLPVAKRILLNDKRLRRKVSQSNYDWPESLSWSIEENELSTLFANYARGHIFLQNATLEINEPDDVLITPISLMTHQERIEFFTHLGDFWLEIGTKGFIEQSLTFQEVDQLKPTETEAIDGEGFNIVSPGQYRFRVGQNSKHTYAKMVFQEYLAVEVYW